MHIGYCGIQCHGCDVYKATQMDPGEEKTMLQQAVSKNWTEKFSFNFQVENMICKGCQSDELCGYCSQCNIRSCAREKGGQLCNECAEFPCEKLTQFRQGATNLSEEMAFVF